MFSDFTLSLVVLTALLEAMAQMFTRRGLFYWMITLAVVILAATRLLKHTLRCAASLYRHEFSVYMAITRHDLTVTPPLQHVRKTDVAKKRSRGEVFNGL